MILSQRQPKTLEHFALENMESVRTKLPESRVKYGIIKLSLRNIFVNMENEIADQIS